eukprot:Gb_22193 [translate_table: standard]
MSCRDDKGYFDRHALAASHRTGRIERPQKKTRLPLRDKTPILNGEKGALEEKGKWSSVTEEIVTKERCVLRKILSVSQQDTRMVIRSRSAYWMPSGIVEVKIAAVAVALRVTVKVADMPPFLQEQAFRCARQTLDSMDKLSCRGVARSLKQEFDRCYGPAWHCIVGTSFGSFVTHSLRCFLYFSVDKVSVLLFKTTVERIGQ